MGLWIRSTNPLALRKQDQRIKVFEYFKVIRVNVFFEKLVFEEFKQGTSLFSKDVSKRVIDKGFAFCGEGEPETRNSCLRLLRPTPFLYPFRTLT